MAGMSEADIIARFKAEFPSAAEARKDLTGLGTNQLASRDWYQAARVRFRGDRGYTGRHYEDILPRLVHEAWGLEMERARTFAVEVQTALKAARTEKKRELLLSLKQIEQRFLVDFPTKEAAEADIGAFSQRQLETKLWYISALRRLKLDNQNHATHYDIIRYLARKCWGLNTDEIEEFVSEVRGRIAKVRGEQMARSKGILSDDEIMQAFLDEFPNPESMGEDLTVLGQEKLMDRGWYRTMTYRTKSRGGHYRGVLPRLLRVGWRLDDTAANDLADRIRIACNEQKRRRLSEAKMTRTPEQIKTEFLSDFPTQEAARTKIEEFGYLKVFGFITLETRGWYNPAGTLFKPPGSRNNAKHYDIIRNLAMMCWELDEIAAAEFIERLRSAREEEKCRNTLSTNAIRRSEPANHSYAVNLGNLNHSLEGVSFEGIARCLSFDSVQVSNGYGSSIARAILDVAPPTRAELSEAQLLRIKTSTGRWNGEMAEAYAKAFPHIAPYLTTRLLLLHTFALVMEGRLPELRTGASFMSGPGEVYGALQDLRIELAAVGIQIPTLVDIDAEEDMLKQSKNPNQRIATLPKSGLDAGSQDFVECSSLYQFPSRTFPSIVRDTIAEAHRVLKEGGVLLLTATAKQFGHNFDEGLRLLGFDIVTPANSRLLLTPEAERRILEVAGHEVLAKARNAVRSTTYLIARRRQATKSTESKSEVRLEDVPPGDVPVENVSLENLLLEHLVFVRKEVKLPPEAQRLAKLSREFRNALVAGDYESAVNAAGVLTVLEGLSAEEHMTHARLIQAMLRHIYMFEPRSETVDTDTNGSAERKKTKAKDSPEMHVSNANQLAELMAGIPIKGDEDKYFGYLQRAAVLHSQRINQAAGMLTAKAQTVQARKAG